MHELAVAQEIIRLATERANGLPVVEITLQVGDSGCVAAESIRMYFDIFAEGTACENAQILVEAVQGRDFYIQSITVEEDT
jgi:Zn finger protein HypA/HybF involved in hydrogenase expression